MAQFFSFTAQTHPLPPKISLVIQKNEVKFHVGEHVCLNLQSLGCLANSFFRKEYMFVLTLDILPMVQYIKMKSPIRTDKGVH